MTDQKPTRRRKWLLISAGIVLSIPILIVLVLMILGRVHSVRPDQMQPPARFVKSSSGAPPLKHPSVANPTFADYFALANGDEAADLYRKYMNQLDPQNPVLNHKPGQPLSPQEKDWLLTHAEMLNGLIRMCRLSGKPVLTCEQAAGMTREERYSSAGPRPDLTKCTWLRKLLSAEADRRFEAGDVKGAADSLLAINPFAQTIREPDLINHLVALSWQVDTARQLGEWISKGSIPPDTARGIRDRLSQNIITVADCRRTFQADYEFTRREIIEGLSLSTPDLVRLVVGGPNGKLKSAGMLEIMWSHPRDFAIATVAGTVAKANASTILDRYDAMYATAFRAIDENTRAGNLDQKILDMPFAPSMDVAVDETRARTNLCLAQTRLNIAGLNAIAGDSAAVIDPFTNQPLKTIRQDKTIIIYSVGPDQIDQHGAVAYDPNKGALSPGDIILRISQ